LSDVSKKYTTFQEKRCTSPLIGIGGCDCSRIERGCGTGLLLQKGVVFAHLFAHILLARRTFFAAENDLLEKEDMILPVEIRLGDGENIIKKELAEIV